MSARLVVLLSGSGTNLQAVLDACAEGALDAAVVLVVSNRRDAFGLTRARDAGVPTLYLPLADFKAQGRAAYDQALADALQPAAPDLVVLAGWMHVLSAAFLDRVTCPVLNLHPALPGQLPGRDAIARAWRAARDEGLRQTGVMVHHTTTEVDAGPVVLAEPLDLRPDEPLDALTARVRAVEHRVLIEAIRQVLHAAARPSCQNMYPQRPM